MSNTILLKGRGIRKERISAAAITPGYLVDFNAAGLVLKHAGAGLNASAAFAVEDELNGKAITEAWASGDQVVYEIMPSGSEVYALVAAAAAAIVIGDELESAGDGTLRKLTVDVATDNTQRIAVVARAIEAVDNSGGGTEARLKVEIV